MEIPSTPRHRRRAKAEGAIEIAAALRSELEAGSLLEEARVAAVLAARNADAFLPRTADAEMTEVSIDFDWDGAERVQVKAYLEGYARDGLGSRAMVAVQTCAASLIDALPADSVALADASVVMERGGLQGLEYDFDPAVRAAILVVSDAVVSGAKEDRAGERIRQGVEELEAHGVDLVAYEVVSDDRETVADRVREWRDRGLDLVLTVGGTGLTHTDVTVEAVEPLVDRAVPGLAEAIRDYGQEQTPVAFMSRGIAGLVGEMLVVTLPGSTAGAREAREAIFPAVLHVFETLRKSREMLA